MHLLLLALTLAPRAEAPATNRALLTSVETNPSAVTNTAGTNTRRAVRIHLQMRGIEKSWIEKRIRGRELARAIERLKVKRDRGRSGDYELSRLLERMRQLVLEMEELKEEHVRLGRMLRTICSNALGQPRLPVREREVVRALLARPSPFPGPGPIVGTLIDQLRGMERRARALTRRLERNARFLAEGNPAVRARIERENSFIERELDTLVEQADTIERDTLEKLEASRKDRLEADSLLRSIRRERSRARRLLR